MSTKVRQENEACGGARVDSVRDYGIIMLDADGRIRGCNEGARTITGYQERELLGCSFAQFFTREDLAAEKPRWLLKRAATNGHAFDAGWRLRKDGSQFWAEVMITATRDHQGTLVGFTKVTRDMTERLRHEEELRMRARQQGAVAELGLFALQSRDLQVVLERAADVAGATLGLELVRVLELREGNGALVMRAEVGWEGRGAPANITATEGSQAAFVLQAEEPVVIEDLVRERRFVPSRLVGERGAKSGVSVLIHASGERNRPYGMLDAYAKRLRRFTADELFFLQSVANVIASAISRRRMERQLQAAEHEAEMARQRTLRAQESVRERDEFLSVAAHELRTPLTALQLKLQSIDSARRKGLGEAPAAKIEARVEGALRQTERLTALVDRLLDVSRIAQGRLELTVEEFDLSSLLGELVEDLGEQAASARSEIHIDAPASLVGVWDRGRLSQAVLNVLANAIKYGGGKPIDLRLEGHAERVRIAVEDHGIGILADDCSRIFRRFERAAPLSNYGGLGLGLYITRHIIEAHGGAVQVRSEPGQGAIFIFELPRRTAVRPVLDDDLHAE